MRVLLGSALLYLTGVVVVLYLKPHVMFTEDGRWKEFSLSADSNSTRFPFWLFCIVWAILSYAIVKFCFSTLPTVDAPSNLKKGSPLKKGIYVLNHEASEIEGAPRYVYVGETTA